MIQYRLTKSDESLFQNSTLTLTKELHFFLTSNDNLFFVIDKEANLPEISPV